MPEFSVASDCGSCCEIGLWPSKRFLKETKEEGKEKQKSTSGSLGVPELPRGFQLPLALDVKAAWLCAPGGRGRLLQRAGRSLQDGAWRSSLPSCGVGIHEPVSKVTQGKLTPEEVNII